MICSIQEDWLSSAISGRSRRHLQLHSWKKEKLGSYSSSFDTGKVCGESLASRVPYFRKVLKMQRLKSKGYLQMKVHHGGQGNTATSQANYMVFFLWGRQAERSIFFVSLPCMQILIPRKLFCLRSNNLLYLLATHCNYKFQCKLFINKEIYPLFHGVLFYLIKDIVKASTNIFYTHMESLLNLAVFTSCFSSTHLVSCCLTAPLKWLHLSGWWND